MEIAESYTRPPPKKTTKEPHTNKQLVGKNVETDVNQCESRGEECRTENQTNNKKPTKQPSQPSGDLKERQLPQRAVDQNLY